MGLSPDDPVWDPTTFTKNRDRLQNGEVFAKFMTKLLNHPQVKPLMSDEHFSVDGTLIEAWASHKSFRPKDGSGDEDGGANFHGQQRKNDTHACFRTCCRKLAAEVALVEAVYILRNSAKAIGVRRVLLPGHGSRCSVD